VTEDTTEGLTSAIWAKLQQRVSNIDEAVCDGVGKTLIWTAEGIVTGWWKINLRVLGKTLLGRLAAPRKWRTLRYSLRRRKVPTWRASISWSMTVWRSG